jgi:hypothetical protein
MFCVSGLVLPGKAESEQDEHTDPEPEQRPGGVGLDLMTATLAPHD